MLYPPAILPRQVTNMAAPPLQAQAIQSMVPPPPDPTLPPEAAQTKHAERGAMILTALKQLGAMGQQQQAVNPSDLMPDIGGAKGAGFLGSRIVQTKQEQQLRANMAAAQMNQQQQRDLMQQQAVETQRADQIAYQETKLKNDMKIQKMEMDAKKAEKDAYNASPEGRMKSLQIERDTIKLQNELAGVEEISNAEKNMFRQMLEDGYGYAEAKAFVEGNELSPLSAPQGGGGGGRGRSGGGGSSTPKPVKLPTVTATDLSYAQKLLEEAGEAPTPPTGRAGISLGGFGTLGQSVPTQEEVNAYAKARTAWDKKTAAAKAIINAYQAQGEAKAEAFGVGAPQPQAVIPQATPDEDAQAIAWAQANPNDPRAQAILAGIGK